MQTTTDFCPRQESGTLCYRGEKKKTEKSEATLEQGKEKEPDLRDRFSCGINTDASHTRRSGVHSKALTSLTWRSIRCWMYTGQALTFLHVKRFISNPWTNGRTLQQKQPSGRTSQDTFSVILFCSFFGLLSYPPCPVEGVTHSFSSPRRHQPVTRATHLSLTPKICFLPLLLAQSMEMAAQRPSGSRWEQTLHFLIPSADSQFKKKKKEKSSPHPPSPSFSLTYTASLLPDCSLRKRKERGPKGS